jgi:hypothetical protein
MSRFAALVALVLAAAVPGAARACSVCSCGDPLVSASEGHGKGGDLRVQLDPEYLRVRSGEDVLDQYTLRLTGVYSPADPVNLVVQVPFTRKKMFMDHGAAGTMPMSDVNGLGDVEVGARWFFWERTDFAAMRRQGLALSAGTSIPTGSIGARDELGALVDAHGQVGTGSWGPNVGALYRLQQDPWNGLVSVTARTHGTSSADYRYGDSLGWTAQAQWHPAQRVALGLGLDGRWAARDREAGDLVPDTGGVVLAATPAAYYNVAGGLWLSARVQVPFFTHLYGEQSVGAVVTAGLQYQVF